jgi:ABC-2 type transport system permease protein
MLTFILLGAAVQAMNLGVGIMSKEISAKTADFLLTKPLSRASVITSKLTASISLIILTNIFLLTVSIFAANKIVPTDFSFKVFGLLVSTIFFVQVGFLVLGFMLAVIIPKIKSVISVSLPVVFSLFIIGTLGAIIGNDNVRYITIFKFFDTNYIIKNATYEPKYIVVETMLLVIAVLTSYIVFIRKDIQVTQ